MDENKFDKVVFTRFINSYDSIWFTKLNYKGCIIEEDRKIVIDTRGNTIIDKQVYSALGSDLKKYIYAE